MKIEYLAKKREKNLDYLSTAFRDKVWWMNSVMLSGTRIIASHPPEVIQKQAKQLFVLSLCISRLTNIGSASSMIGSLRQLLEEYDRFYNSDSKLNPIVLSTQATDLQSFKGVQECSAQLNEKKKQFLDRLRTDNILNLEEEYPGESSVRRTIAIPSEGLELKPMVLEPPPTIPKSPGSARKFSPKVIPYNLLTIFNVPFELNFKEEVSRLCELLKTVYDIFKTVKSCDEKQEKELCFIDNLIKMEVLRPLCKLINEAASQIINRQIDALYL